MRTPPPLLLACGLNGAWRVALAGVVGASAATFALWLAAQAGAPRAPAALLAIGAAAGAWRWLPRAASALAWDGRQWHLRDPAGPVGDLALMLDLGRWLLLCHRAPAGPAAWLPLTLPADAAAAARIRATLWQARPAAQRPGKG